MPGIADEVIGRQNEQQWIVTCAVALSAATVTAGAVLRPIGSSRMAFGSTPI